MDLDGWTPLHAAAHWGQGEACRILAEQLCNMEARSNAVWFVNIKKIVSCYIMSLLSLLSFAEAEFTITVKAFVEELTVYGFFCVFFLNFLFITLFFLLCRVKRHLMLPMKAWRSSWRSYHRNKQMWASLSKPGIAWNYFMDIFFFKYWKQCLSPQSILDKQNQPGSPAANAPNKRRRLVCTCKLSLKFPD